MSEIKLNDLEHLSVATMKILIFIDVYGCIGVAQKFPNDEEHEGLNVMLDELVEEDFYGDTYSNLKSGFYIAEMEIHAEPSDYYGETDGYLQIKEIVHTPGDINDK